MDWPVFLAKSNVSYTKNKTKPNRGNKHAVDADGLSELQNTSCFAASLVISNGTSWLCVGAGAGLLPPQSFNMSGRSRLLEVGNDYVARTIENIEPRRLLEVLGSDSDDGEASEGMIQIGPVRARVIPSPPSSGNHEPEKILTHSDGYPSDEQDQLDSAEGHPCMALADNLDGIEIIRHEGDLYEWLNNVYGEHQAGGEGRVHLVEVMESLQSELLCPLHTVDSAGRRVHGHDAVKVIYPGSYAVCHSPFCRISIYFFQFSDTCVLASVCNNPGCDQTFDWQRYTAAVNVDMSITEFYEVFPREIDSQQLLCTCALATIENMLPCWEQLYEEDDEISIADRYYHFVSEYAPWGALLLIQRPSSCSAKCH
jgi:hypothetical protein